MARYEKGHKDETRQRILDVAARQFRERGTSSAGLAGIMAEAGLTNGAFYIHFESKQDLIRAVLDDALARREQVWRKLEDADDGLVAMIDDYLSARHRDNPGRGCPTAAMVAEVAREPAATRATFTERLAAIITRMAAKVKGSSAELREADALAIYALMVGSLQLARAVNDKRLSDKILASGASAARKLAGE
ncbi:MAG: TetR/AcrR family transcriptional regulator, transcriptional repressor for nem operon [Bradyrhizobium sp.]|jgi:AcrR family transcriptional regulator|nr:TetR family transcriptional regulator [Bradyrhizobium sp.]